MKNNDLISFTLAGLSTEQFAILEDTGSYRDELDLQTSLKFGVDNSKKQIVVFSKFRFEHAKNPIIVLEVSSVFKIKEYSWNDLINDNEIKFPKNFILHLAMLTIGAARGILHAKTEKSNYHSVLLPTINVNEIIGNDLVVVLDK